MSEEYIFRLELRHSLDPCYLRQNYYSTYLKINYTVCSTLDFVSL